MDVNVLRMVEIELTKAARGPSGTEEVSARSIRLRAPAMSGSNDGSATLKSTRHATHPNQQTSAQQPWRQLTVVDDLRHAGPQLLVKTLTHPEVRFRKVRNVERHLLPIQQRLVQAPLPECLARPLLQRVHRAGGLAVERVYAHNILSLEELREKVRAKTSARTRNEHGLCCHGRAVRVAIGMTVCSLHGEVALETLAVLVEQRAHALDRSRALRIRVDCLAGDEPRDVLGESRDGGVGVDEVGRDVVYVDGRRRAEGVGDRVADPSCLKTVSRVSVMKYVCVNTETYLSQPCWKISSPSLTATFFITFRTTSVT